MLPKMIRVRQTFAGPRLTDIPRTVAERLEGAGLPVKRGDTVAVGAGSRGIANIDTIVGATVRWLRDRGARPFVFPAMGSHGGGTPEGQLSVLEHYGITEATMGCPVRATMDVVQVGEALGLPVWLDRHAADADWIGLVNRVKPHTDFKGSIESGLFKMMTIGLGKYKGAIQYHRANVQHGYETVITSVGREMLARARIGFGLGIVENGYDETALVEAFTAQDLEAGERRLLKSAREWMARLPFSPIDVLVVEQMGKNISGSGMDTNVIGRPTNPHEPFPSDPKILWIVAHRLLARDGQGARHLRDRSGGDRDRAVVHRADAARAGARRPHQEHAPARRDRGLRGLRGRGRQASRPDSPGRGPAGFRRERSTAPSLTAPARHGSVGA